jgi:hypothetical protein
LRLRLRGGRPLSRPPEQFQSEIALIQAGLCVNQEVAFLLTTIAGMSLDFKKKIFFYVILRVVSAWREIA